MSLLRWVLPLAGLLVLSGCAGGRTAAAAGPAKTSTVNLPPSYRFDPDVIQVPAGTTVTWTNNDNFTHSVLVTGTNDVHNMKPGEKTTITFNTPGQFDYVCTYHTQNMKGRVIVT